MVMSWFDVWYEHGQMYMYVSVQKSRPIWYYITPING